MSEWILESYNLKMRTGLKWLEGGLVADLREDGNGGSVPLKGGD
jgi:hypothetical protein